MSIVNEGCGCVGCRYFGKIEGGNDKMFLLMMFVMVDSKVMMEFENYKLISIVFRLEIVVVDLIVILLNLNLM